MFLLTVKITLEKNKLKPDCEDRRLLFFCIQSFSSPLLQKKKAVCGSEIKDMSKIIMNIKKKQDLKSH